MFDRISTTTGRKAVLATVAVLALTTAAPSTSFAGGRHWHGGGGAAAAAAFAGIVGTGLAIAAARDAYAYDYGPAYYGGPGYYGGPAYYGDGYYHRSDYPYHGVIGRDPFANCSRSGAGCW
ncbi:hypothetical protein NLM33_26390 [Bradyrhizobium sp. CCGUVB1N3]|uniref:hypothetical protein n=1 Tax=Bradyrhizobium sp. CCGUVB1N3 TaxID=2949629 RepID=UPI0020B35362|nr:hypothetical protein [Bradyrhizobium sp. CCGUVB1N3]MCP3473849.1 hypothetical protein [Bradyrhizobium sp. CCGUVB1N3]